ncbi:MAG: YbhB/YbcL family Raf kinase inhibitor-like protein [Vicinamibacterales bacterium]
MGAVHTKPVFALAVTALLALGPLTALAEGQRPGGPAPQPPRGRRVPVQAMTLSTTAWQDGGRIPAKYTQAGPEVSPPLGWTPAPEGTVSYVLVAHDVDAAIGDGTDDVLHWLVWNIPATLTGLPEAVPMSPELPDGTRQISQTGPYYRGPGAMADGPVHHYVFEVYALDTMLDIAPVGQSPAATRAAVMAAMAGHVRGKGSLVGLFRR